MELPQWVTNWKAILGSVAAVLVVLLQVIQLLLSGTIERQVEVNSSKIANNTQAIDSKTEALEAKTEVINASLAAHGQITKGNRELLIELHNELHSLEEAQRVAHPPKKNGVRK